MSTESVQSPNLVDKTAMFLDTYDPIHRMPLSVPLGLLSGAVAGYSVEHFLVDGLFTTNHTYQAIDSQLEQVQASRSGLLQAIHTFATNGIPMGKQEVANKLSQFSSEINHLQASLPGGYQPHLEGLADVGSFALAAVVVFIGIQKFVRHYSRRGRSRLADQPVASF